MTLESVANGSVTSPTGFVASGVAAGIKASGRPDVALVVSRVPAVAAAAFTTNRFAAAPVIYGRDLLGRTAGARAVVINSGNANACTGAQGLTDTQHTAAATANLLDIEPESVLVCSTGRIGVPLPMPTLLDGIAAAVRSLDADGGSRAAEAILTTDTRAKTLAVTVPAAGRRVCIGGMAKGAGMIAPKLRPVAPHATMLAVLTTDAAVDPAFWRHGLETGLPQSFNRITVDGDASTNDSVIALANGAAGNDPPLTADGPDGNAFLEALHAVMAALAREIVLDGEGVTRFVELHVSGAQTEGDARHCAEAIANSPLCKTAWFGGDPNWGRILCTAGHCGAALDPERVSLDFEGVPVIRNGRDAGTAEAALAQAVDRREFHIDLDLGVGTAAWTVWTCDLSYEYVKINAEYHT